MVITITAMVGLVFSNEHNIYKRNHGNITIDRDFMPVLEELIIDLARITIPRQIQLELDNTRELDQLENTSRIECDNRLGNKRIRINKPIDINININPRGIVQEYRPESSRGLLRSRSQSKYESNRLA